MTIRVGIVGLGRAGRVHLEAWQSLADVEVVAVADPAPIARDLAHTRVAHVYADPLRMMERERLDAISICTPPSEHPELAVAAARRGLHVLCEKPLATDTGAALRMVRGASAARRHLLLATKFRHVDDLVRARRLIGEGAIGVPVRFEIEFASLVDMTRRWNSDPRLSGGGVIIDNGCHAFDIVNFLFGSVIGVLATELKRVQSVDVEDSAAILVTASRGLIGTINLSWSLPSGSGAYVRVHGTAGSIEVNWQGSRVCRPAKEPEAIGVGYDKVAAHRRMMRDFCDVIRGARRPWISPGDALRTVAAVDAAYRSIWRGGWIEVRDTVRPVDRRHAALHP
jgi:predicted dehydrogenase